MYKNPSWSLYLWKWCHHTTNINQLWPCLDPKFNGWEHSASSCWRPTKLLSACHLNRGQAREFRGFQPVALVFNWGLSILFPPLSFSYKHSIALITWLWWSLILLFQYPHSQHICLGPLCIHQGGCKTTNHLIKRNSRNWSHNPSPWRSNATRKSLTRSQHTI